ncbi:hypothetical protein [Rivihabitans pingtungensis]|uniref:hypothetical protein n=1 Tax=Rivihabitans pingtungensis TaxID=1054498 RepID=UPI0023559EFB|nr:hypothetical protein [Rivihabitans pingtungensis]
MPKMYQIAIDDFQAKALFSSATRRKRDVIKIWMEVIKIFLVNNPATGKDVSAKISIVADSTSRVFFEKNNDSTIFSLSFPFKISKRDEQLEFFSRGKVCIDSKNSSSIISLIDEEHENILGQEHFLDFVEPIFDADCDQNPSLWSLLIELILAEDTYIRYDFDHKNQNGHLHPLHHLDIGYSSYGTFKIGLEESIDKDTLASILSQESDCHYLVPANRSNSLAKSKNNR